MASDPQTLLDLWKKVLTKALEDAKDGPSEREIKDYIFCTKRNAEDWFRSDSEEPGSFLWVCDVLDLSASVVLKQLKLPKRKK